MNIKIQKPELEALILERMKSGGFQSVEDVLIQALKSAPPAPVYVAALSDNSTGADLVAAMQASPYREIDLEPARARLPIRGVMF